MHQILLVVQVLIAVGVIGLVLLQQGKGADAGAAFGSGGAGSVFGSRGPATLLTRMTAILAAVFFVNSIGLAYLARDVFDPESERGGALPGRGHEPGGGRGIRSLSPRRRLTASPADVPDLPETLEEEGS